MYNGICYTEQISFQWDYMTHNMILFLPSASSYNFISGNNLNPLSTGTSFIRQNLTADLQMYKDGPRTGGIKIFIMAIDP